MKKSTNARRNFIGTSLLGISIASITSGFAFIQEGKKTPLDQDLVYNFVLKAHGDLDFIKAQLQMHPALLHASHDWGNGDFESGIEACSHVGNKPLVNFLLSQGARMNIFTAAMMGYYDVVRSLLNHKPELIKSKGPHGLDLFHHAKVGGEDAKPVLEFLESKKGSIIDNNEFTKDLQASNEMEKIAIAHKEFIHSPDRDIVAFVNQYYHFDFVNERGMEFFEAAFKKFKADIPTCYVSLLETKSNNECWMKLTRVDNPERNFYFQFTFKFREKPLVSGLRSAARNIFE